MRDKIIHKNIFSICSVALAVIMMSLCFCEHSPKGRLNPCDPDGENYLVWAGDDITVSFDDTVKLHGEASPDETIIKWEWKIGDNSWIVTSCGDTDIIAPSIRQTFVCKLKVTNDYGAIAYNSLEVAVRFTDVSLISAGGWHTMILKSDGILWATGRNHYGQLGDGTNIDKNSPVQIMSNVSSISAGTDHTMILKSDGTLWATGSNLFDELGDGGSGHKNRPVYIMNGISSVFGGMCNTLIIKTDGTLWAVGRNFGESFSIKYQTRAQR